ncbi:thioredoxin domain-containing protein [Thiomicrorhabdus sp. 6S2-11]|uniref:Thioredoxin domain-containing protein n=1 Tax=Thiomicrorhabdus marina TaxID=2818442 RepID=A0ABS3Q2V2_9GAMM|nr:thioredoxin domain-containing protein [Thiomicrorhabdus marina]MBO1926666.1 thioredoxin domain-containing protein [Thiomicrorhabdus marina]
MKKTLIGLGVMLVVAVIAATFLLQADKNSDSDTNLIRAHSPIIGPQDAPVTLVEFIDPACEACRAMYPYVKQIISENPNKIKLVIRYVDFHKQSKQAIQILEASRKQGKFAETLELMLAFQPVWAPHGHEGVDLWEVMIRGDLNLDQAKIDAKAETIDAVITQDEKDRIALGVQKTPGFFVNGQILKIMHPDVLREMIEEQLNSGKLQD